jgi:hypothetical protein
MNVPGDVHDNPNASKLHRSFDDIKMSAFGPWRISSPSLHVTAGHDLMHIPYEILGSLISIFFTPLDFKNYDSRSRKKTHLDQRMNFI